MSRTRRFLKELAGPHVLFAFAVGAVNAGLLLESLNLLIPASLGFAAAAAAVLARRLTGNTLVSACAGALVALHPDATLRVILVNWDRALPSGFELPQTRLVMKTIVDFLAVGSGMLAAGVRLLPSPEVEGAPLLGKREWLALALLALAGLGTPAMLAMPVLILAGDLAFAPAGIRTVLRRGGPLFFLHAVAVSTTFFHVGDLAARLSMIDGDRISEMKRGIVEVLEPFASVDILGRHERLLAPSFVCACLALAVVVLFLRSRIRQTLVVTTAFAVVWVGAAQGARFLIPSDRSFPHSILSLFGVALLIPAILWRIAIALTQPRRLQHGELPIPSVPALRDLIRGLPAGPVAAPAAASPAARATDPTIGLASTIETAVASAVSATLEQIRLAFRGSHVGESAGAPDQLLWNRLLSGSSGGVLPGEKPGEALARWRAIHDQHLKPGLPSGSRVICVGSTPWPLVLALADVQRHVILVERSGKTARIARADLASVRNVKVIRHDGRALRAIADGAAFAVLVLVEASRELPADVVSLLRECRRVVHAGGVAIVGFADLALPASQEALTRGAPTDLFTVQGAVEALARLAGLKVRSFTSGILPTVSLAWLERAP